MSFVPPAIKTLDACVIADVHLGTKVCRAAELLNYLCSIQTRILIIAGDLVGVDRSVRPDFTEHQLAIVHRLLEMMRVGTKVYYLSGNHDQHLRRFGDLALGNLYIREEAVLRLDGRKYWILHGDQFNAAVRYQLPITKMSSPRYKFLRWYHRSCNRVERTFRLPAWSLAREANGVKPKSQQYADAFVSTAIRLAAEQEFDSVITAHIRQPAIKTATYGEQEVHYMNAGDWVTNLSSLEYRFKQWNLYFYDNYDFPNLGRRLTVPRRRVPGRNLEDDLVARMILRARP